MQDANRWYSLTAEQVLRHWGTDPKQGIRALDAARLRTEFGSNVLVEVEGRSRWVILWAQLKSSLVALLLAATVISLVVGDSHDAIAILAILVLNTILGYWQDFRAEQSLSALRKLSVPSVSVRRDGEVVVLPSADLVPGDLIYLQTGYYVPADCRLIEVVDLAIDESALTGESLAVEKSMDVLPDTMLATGDQINLGFSGTMVERGHGVAVVVATGMQTELGQIAHSLQSVVAEPAPLQIRLARLSRVLALTAIGIVTLVFGIGLLTGQDQQLMLMTALSLAVAIVPEGLPAVATVALAIGARRMLQRNALIRQLPAVETLGSVSVICSDKTGTLTQNLMTVSSLDVAGQRLSVDDGQAGGLPSPSPAIELLLIGACLCNDAQLQAESASPDAPAGSTPVAVGEPTEQALVEVAARFGLSQHELVRCFPRKSEIAFSSQRQRMTTIHQVDPRELASVRASRRDWLTGDWVAFSKGSVASLLAICDHFWEGGASQPLTAAGRQRIEQAETELAGSGVRVLAVAFRILDDGRDLEAMESGLTFVGLLGLADPARPEAAEAVRLCGQAGIRSLMITGDHPLTAVSIARQLGISGNSRYLTGQQLAEMSARELQQVIADVAVFARVAPVDKLRIVEALQTTGQVVAMTGDGVNDAPALKQADIGVAMGCKGTDVSKQAANMILLDDNFATIVAAVEQGRMVYANVRKFVRYTMSSNIGEVLVMMFGITLGLPLPLLPLQILWVNLVTDGLPGLALAVEPVEPNAMKQPPIPPEAPIFSPAMWLDVFGIGLLIGLVSLCSGWWLADPKNLTQWRTCIFTALTFAQMGNALAIRSNQRLLFSSRVVSNPWLWGAIALTAGLQFAVIYLPWLQGTFSTTWLTSVQLAGCLAAGAIVFFVVEARKRFIALT